jgi:hypothetical protein
VANKVGWFWPEFFSKTRLAAQKRGKKFLDFAFDRQIPDENGVLWPPLAISQASRGSELIGPLPREGVK